MGTEYTDEQFKKLENNRRKIFDKLIEYLQKENIRYKANGEENTVNSIEIPLPLGKTYVITVEVRKMENEFVNFFQTSELINISADFPKFALANIYVLDIVNNLVNESAFLNERVLSEAGSFGRTLKKPRKVVLDFPDDYVTALKQVASDNLETMYSVDTLVTFLETEGYSNTVGIEWVHRVHTDKAKIYVPVMYGQYFSGKQIMSILSSTELFGKFLQFAK